MRVKFRLDLVNGFAPDVQQWTKQTAIDATKVQLELQLVARISQNITTNSPNFSIHSAGIHVFEAIIFSTEAAREFERDLDRKFSFQIVPKFKNYIK